MRNKAAKYVYSFFQSLAYFLRSPTIIPTGTLSLYPNITTGDP